MAKPKKLTPAEEAKKAAAALEKANADLLKAAKNDEAGKAEKAIAAGAALDTKNAHENTPIHIAAGFGALKVIRVLHKAGAALDQPNKKGLTPLEMARSINEPDAAALIEALLNGESGDGIGDAAAAEDDAEADAEAGAAGGAAGSAEGGEPPASDGVAEVGAALAEAKVTDGDS